jgi:hypothetical protein
VKSPYRPLGQGQCSQKKKYRAMNARYFVVLLWS